MGTFVKDLEELINKYSLEKDSNTPDFILAKFLEASLNVYSETITARDKWFGLTR